MVDYFIKRYHRKQYSKVRSGITKQIHKDMIEIKSQSKPIINRNDMIEFGCYGFSLVVAIGVIILNLVN